MAATDHDLDRVRRAIALAAKGRFAVEPNPLVGCVLEKDGRVVGEGWHAAYGGPHAEVAALARAGDAARGATAYVSLEPCSLTLKTGACTVALAQAGVRRVVFASSDPNMPSEGLNTLRTAGVGVEGPVLPEEGAPLLARFLPGLDRAQPWVVLKWAMSADGRIAPAVGRGGPISGARAHAFVHGIRAHVDAVAVGTETARIDDPRLTCRLEGGPPHGRPQPLRVVFDDALATPPTARLLDDAPDVPCLILTAVDDGDRHAALTAKGAEVAIVPPGEGGLDLQAALAFLRKRGVRRLLVEGGARLHGSFLRAGLADQVSAFVAPIVLGGEGAPSAVSGTGITAVDAAYRLTDTRWRKLGDDLLLEGYVAP